MGQDINIGFVGAGYWGGKLLPKFLAAPRVSIGAVCDTHPANRQEIETKYPHIRTVSSIDALLERNEIDAVVIVTPPSTHYALAKKALEAGKHVWIEKPLALQLNEGYELVRIARDADAIIFVDHTFLYDPAVSMIRDLIQGGELGEIYHLYLQRLNLGRIKRDSNVWWNSAPHDASIVLHLLPGLPKSVHLHGYRYLQPSLEDLNMAIIEMSDGTSAFVYHSWLFPENTARLTVIGSKRFVVYEGKFDKRSVTVFDYELDLSKECTTAGELPTTIPSKITSTRNLEGFQSSEPLSAAIDDFLAAIRSGKKPVSDGEFSLRVLALLEAGERSLRACGERMPVEIQHLG
jgi:UDP-2-acetamido-3-amino-2,3-dideoxy-glucuronate N-acetyltransferase